MAAKGASTVRDVSIELDFEDDAVLESDVYPDNSLEEDDDVVIDAPILLSQVSFQVPPGIRVREMSQEFKDVIADNLDLPSAVSIATWSTVCSILNKNHDCDVDNQRSTRDIMKQLKNLEADILVNVIRDAQRVDILVKLNSIINSGNYLREPKDLTGFSDATTVRIQSPRMMPSVETRKQSGHNVVLVLYYDKTKEERKNTKWLIKNLKMNLKETNINILDVDVLEKEDGGNVIKTLDEMWDELAHIVVCYNESHLNALRSAEISPDFRLRKHIHNKINTEFYLNDGRNKRARCVIMPGVDEAEKNGWSAVTVKYFFPSNCKALIERLAKEKTETNGNNTVCVDQ